MQDSLNLSHCKLTLQPVRRWQLLFVLLLTSSRSYAQTDADALPAWPARWSVGGQLAFYPRIAFAEAPAGQNGPVCTRPWPAMLTLRYRARPRAALEAGLLLRAGPTQTTSQPTSGGRYLTTTRARTYAVPLVARVQLAPRRPKRWQLDAVYGLMPLSAQYTEENTFVDARTGQSTSYGSRREAYSDLPVLAGIGGTYVLTPRASLTADARFAWSFLATLLVRALSRRNDSVAPVVPALSTGLSYQFGRRAP